ncbi:CPBP family intramembrane metalloprotease [Chromobacterium phragmitis]|uniref:CPBP family intramembrane glutamic endopeptidase n=1 Tax=Chromobacterium phragmitis TaxID=2202141 RepID=UPI000DEC938A|nr:CPBP family intramembrane glutamic endopeptidase [Chromobacterium phragmitis]AXE29118.1 CPBP family intramembrane metalloprotease [Chromobacterium phragmitis]
MRAALKALPVAERQALAVLLVSSLCMVWLQYPANRFWMLAALSRWLPDAAEWFRAAVIHNPHTELYRSAYWALASIAGYVLLPLVHIRLKSEKLSDYGLAWPDRATLRADLKLFPLFYALMLPLVWRASAQPGFLAIYPFFRLSPGEALWPHWLLWEMLYFAQFAALEFFFRGYMVHGLKPRLGWLAVFVMIIPYCMIHFEKPALESLAAIVAGAALGLLSYRYKSIWLGAALHCSVALTMDLMALWRKGLL